jgi:tetratricopeptide (TPR) repeat protein
MKKITHCLLTFILAVAPSYALCQEQGANAEVVETLIRQALAAEDSGQYSKSIELFKKTLKIDTNNAKAMNSIAGLYGKEGKFNEELEWAQMAIKANPEFDLAYINQGNAYINLKHPVDAERSFRNAIELNPKSPLGVYSLGVMAENKNEFDKAIEYYRQSIEIDPNFENGYFSLAAMLANTKQFDQAIAALDELLSLNPTAGGAQAMRAQIISEKAKK